MKDYLLLLRVNIKTMLRGAFSSSIRGDNGKLKISYILLYILAAIGMLTMGGMVIWLETALYRGVAGANLLPGMRLERLLIGLSLLLSMVMTLLFGVFHTMGAMYFNRDTVATAHLPIGQRVQIAARWTEIYVGEILFSLFILTPMLVNHGIAQGAGVTYYLSALLTLLATPLYPLSTALLLASILARFSSFTRHKEVWMVIGTLLMLVLVLGAEWTLMPNIPEDADAMFFINLLMNNEALLTFVIGAFPPVMWAVDAMSGSLPMLALFILTGAAAIALVIILLGGSFQQVCLRHTEHAVKRKGSVRSKKEAMQPATPFHAIFRREMNEVLKTPVYLMNAVLSVMMMPIMLMGMSVGMTTADESIDIASVIAQLTGALEPTDLTLILAALFSFMVFMCPLTATAISREGKRLPIMRMIPVSARTILWAKLLVGVLIVLLGSVIMGAAIIVLLGTEFLPHVACAVLMANVLSVSVGAGSLLVDVLKPVLTWKSENEVMKQNMNTMYSMLISVAMAALVAVPVVLLLKQAAWLRMAVAALLLLLELAGTILLLETVGCKRLSLLEP